MTIICADGLIKLIFGPRGNRRKRGKGEREGGKGLVSVYILGRGLFVVCCLRFIKTRTGYEIFNYLARK